MTNIQNIRHLFPNPILIPSTISAISKACFSKWRKKLLNKNDENKRREKKNGVTSITSDRKRIGIFFIYFGIHYLSAFSFFEILKFSEVVLLFYSNLPTHHHPLNDTWSWYITFVRYSVAKGKRLYFFFSFLVGRWKKKKIEKK